MPGFDVTAAGELVILYGLPEELEKEQKAWL